MSRFLPGWIFAVCALSGVFAAAAVSQAVSLPDADGKQQVVGACTRCHGVDVIVAQPRSPDEWAEVVSVMIGHGATLTDEEYDKILAYLAKNLARQEASPG